MIMSYALECAVHFLHEKRTKLYGRYYLGVSQWKNVLGAKNGLQRRALPGLGRCGG